MTRLQRPPFAAAQAEPAVQAGAASVAWVALATVHTLTALRAVRSVAAQPAVKVAAGSHPSWGAEASAVPWVTRGTALTVTGLGTVLPKSALLTNSLTAGSMVARRTKAASSAGVTAGVPSAVTEFLTARPIESWWAGMFAEMAVVAWLTVAFSCYPVACAIVLTGTLVLAVYTISSCRTLHVTAGPSPTQSAGAASRHRITYSPITALTALGTVFSKPAWRTTLSTVFSSLSGLTHTSASDRMTPGSFTTECQLCTVLPIATCWACDVAVCPYVPGWALTGASAWHAHTVVQTLALALTVWPIPTLLTVFVTVVAMVTWGAVATAIDGMAQLVGSRALAHLVTVESVGARLAGLFTAVASESGGTAALPSDVITGGTLGTGAALGTVLPEGAWQTGSATLRPPPANGTYTHSSDMVTWRTLLTLTPTRTIWTIQSCRAC